MKSEAQAQYTGEFVPAKRVNKPHYVHKPRPFVSGTTQQEDYKYWGSTAPRKPSETAARCNGVFVDNLPFSGTTTAKEDYRSWNAPPAKLAKEANIRPMYVPDNRNFSTEATAQFDYKPQPADTQYFGPVQTAPLPHSALPFEGQTTNQADFVGHKTRPARSYQQQRRYRPRKEDRHFTTEARGQFIEKDFDPTRKVIGKGTLQRPVAPLPDGTYGYTGTMTDYEYATMPPRPMSGY